MASTALKQRAMKSLDFLSDEQALDAISYMENMGKVENMPLQNSKTPEERKKALEAFLDLEKMSASFVPSGKSSLNGRDEWIEHLWSKYAGLN